MPAAGPPTAAVRPVQQPGTRPKPQQGQQGEPQQGGPQQSGPLGPPPGAQSRPGMSPVGPPTVAQPPVGQPLSRPGVNPVGRAQAGPAAMGTRPPSAPQRPQPPSHDDMATAVHPPMKDEFAGYPPVTPPGPMQARLAGPPPDAATTEEFPPIPGDAQAPLRPAAPSGPPGRGGMQPGPTQLNQPVSPPSMPPGRRPPVAVPLESTQAHPAPFVEDFDDDHDFPAQEFPGSGYREQSFGGTRPPADDADEVFASRDDFDERDDLDRVEGFDGMDDEDDEPVSAGREWLMMGAQVGAGAIAGAAVWLAFSWLWGMVPVVAVLAALVVIVGLVLAVRRWRRADDLQTTVLAILAGLVVTVSPAALLLLRR
jgi:hypothetical protein